MEEAGKNGDVDRAGALIADLERELQAVLAYLNAEIVTLYGA